MIDLPTAGGVRLAGRPPSIAGGDLTGIEWTTPVASAQIKSAVLLAGLHARGTTTVREPLATRDHTERMFRGFGIEITVDGLSCALAGGQEGMAPSGTLGVPGDPSSAAVWAASAAALPGSSVRLEQVCLNPHRTGFMSALERMGAEVVIESRDEIGGETVGTLRVSHNGNAATTIEAADVPALIDELPVLAARAALGGGLTVTGAGELRVKESDRITAVVNGFRTLGVDARELPDGFVIDGHRQPHGGTVDAAGDHRLVMAFTLVGLGSTGPTVITGAEAVAVSYPNFEADLAALTIS